MIYFFDVFYMFCDMNYGVFLMFYDACDVFLMSYL